MEIKIIIWIVLGLIYLFARRKKKPEPPRPQQREYQDDESPAPESDRPKSFEELLREIEQMKDPAPVEPPKTYDLPPPEPVYKKYDSFEEAKKPLENTNYDYRDHDKIYEVYEQAKEQAFHRPSLEESLKLSDTIVRFNQLKGYKQEPKTNQAAEFLNDLRDPKSFRKAFILSEILKPKF